MQYNPDAIIVKLMKNKRIKKRVDELGLSRKQILEALPILIDMSEQKDDKNTKYLTSFYVNDEGEVLRHEIRSSYWARFKYLENIKTLDFEAINFEDDKNFIKENSRKPIVNKIKDYLDEAKSIRGMYIYGDMGVGKTFLLKRIAKKLAENGKQIAFLTVPHFATKIKSMFQDNESYWELINLLKTIDYLFFDDIGAETISGWFRDEILFAILNERMQNAKTTFFTSNYPMAKLEEMQAKTNGFKYWEKEKGARIVSRVRSLANEIYVRGNNKRSF